MTDLEYTTILCHKHLDEIERLQEELLLARKTINKIVEYFVGTDDPTLASLLKVSEEREVYPRD